MQARKLLIKFLPPRCLLRKTCPLNRNRLLNRSHLLRNISFHEKRFPQSLPPLLRPPVHLLRPSPREIGLLLRRRRPLLRRGHLPRTSPQAKKFLQKNNHLPLSAYLLRQASLPRMSLPWWNRCLQLLSIPIKRKRRLPRKRRR